MIIYHYRNLIISSITPNNILNPLLFYIGARAIVKVNGICLEQDKIGYTQGTIKNIYNVYEINKNFPISSYSILESCLFSAVKLTKICS